MERQREQVRHREYLSSEPSYYRPPTERQQIVLGHMQKAGALSSVSLATLLGISYKHVQRALKSLVVRRLVRRFNYPDGSAVYTVLPHPLILMEEHRVYGQLYTKLVSEGWNAEYDIHANNLKIIRPDGTVLRALVPRTYLEKADLYIVPEGLVANISIHGQKYVTVETIRDVDRKVLESIYQFVGK